MSLPAQTAEPGDRERAQFRRAWEAARVGDRATFDQISSGLTDYVLYPYLQYEDYRFRRVVIQPAEMAAFINDHADFAFTPGLRKDWLQALGEMRRWDALLQYAGEAEDTKVQCYLAQARIERGHLDEAMTQAQALWAVGKSQPDECDPVFDWLRKAHGIPPDLAWLRVKRAMEAGNPRMTIYLARFVPAHDRAWVERWQQQDLQGYLHVDQAWKWPDQEQSWDIASFGLKKLARKDPNRARQSFKALDGKIAWRPDQRAEVLREIALWSAVANEPKTIVRMHKVPEEARNDAMLEWWARYGLANGDWAEVILAVAAMGEELKTSDRWRYWGARARLQLGEPDYAMGLLDGLARDATYYGFLAADYLQRPYAICGEDPGVTAEALSQFRDRPAFRRVTELERVGLDHWSRSEWSLNVKLLPPEEKRLAAALAIEQGRPDRAIFALNGSNDRKLYEWRFPLAYAPVVTQQAGKRNLDPAWVMGLMRSESAMAANAISPADARGLMQVLPGTAAQLSRRYGYPYRGSEQLSQPEDNIIFGTLFLRELMNRFDDNPVLVSGAYNAGPGAVKRWLTELPTQDPAIWVEVLPYFETRDYIPRVLAFATIYDWRMQRPVQRITSRMPALYSGTIAAGSKSGLVAEVACPEPMVAQLPGS